MIENKLIQIHERLGNIEGKLDTFMESRKQIDRRVENLENLKSKVLVACGTLAAGCTITVEAVLHIINFSGGKH